MIALPDYAPVVVGGCGGSGTRVVADLLISSGIFLGGDLNPPKDNLLAVLLFNRRSVLLDSQVDFDALVEILRQRMTGATSFDPDVLTRLDALAYRDRHQHSPTFLAERLRLFHDTRAAPGSPGPWGWKMPPSHVLLHRLFAADTSLRYINLVRHGLDMAFSSNQNQLGTWGPVLLDRSVTITPRDSLSYWCAAQARIRRLRVEFPGRILQVRFEDMCQDPIAEARRILTFLEHSVPEQTLATFAKQVITPDTLNRYRSQDLSIFDKDDLAQLALEGYSIDA